MLSAPAELGTTTYPSPPLFGAVGFVADVVLVQHTITLVTVVPAGFVQHEPHTSQSPAVRLIEVILAAVLFVREMAEPTSTVELTYSPTLPAFALLFVVVPTMPLV